MYRKMMFVLLVIASVLNLGNFALILPTKQEDGVKRCIKRIIDVYADDATTVLSIHGNFTKSDFLPHPLQIPMINIDINQKVYNWTYQLSRELVIIDPFNCHFDEIGRLGFWNFADFSKRKFVFLFPNSKSGQLLDVLRYLWQVGIIDVIFLVYNDESRITNVYSGNPYHPFNRCGNVVKGMSWSSCDTIKKQRKTFFRNYSKCRLIYVYEYLFRDANNDLSYLTEFVLSEIVVALNLSLVKKHISTTIPYNEHALILSTMRSCKYKNMSCGEGFIRSMSVWTVPFPKKLGPIEVFKLIFKWNTWVLILLSFTVTWFVWWAISACIRSTNYSSIILDLYSITLTGAMNRIPNCLSLRCLFLSYVIYSIHIQTGFTCNLVTLLTVPQYSTIKTIEELADSDLRILIPHTTADVIFNMTHEGNKIFEKIKNKFLVLSDKEWDKSTTNLQSLDNSSIFIGLGNIPMMVEKLQRKVYFILDETFAGRELRTVTTTPGSYLIKDVNKVIRILRESGLIDYQETIYKRTLKDYIRYYEETNDSTENIVLGMKHVFPIFLFWGAGMFIATCAFVLEHVTYNIKNR